MFTLSCALVGVSFASSPGVATGSFVTPDLSESPLLLGEPGPGPSAHVVGGQPSAPGTWMSTVAVYMSDGGGCTGTLIAPDVVVTAAHCAEATVTQVRVGSVSWSSGGSLIPVAAQHQHPSYDGYDGADIAILELAYPASQTPAVIATTCVTQNDLYDGAAAAIVGFGAISEDGESFSDTRHEGISTVLDADCSQNYVSGVETTCLPSERPAGEMFVGGAVDGCFGDSGGPVYIEGSNGTWYLAGVTSRGGYGPNDLPCGQGGVWVRPDKHLAWIEGIVGALPRPQCGAPPPPVPNDDVDDDVPPPQDPTDPVEPADKPEGGLEATAALMIVKKGTLGAVPIEVEGQSGRVSFEIVAQPLQGSARIQEDGLALYQPGKGARGMDAFDVRVVDRQGNEAVVTVAVQLVGGLGCSTSGGTGSAGLLLLGALLGWRRRR